MTGGAHSRFTTASIRFATSRTVLQNLFPTEEFSFMSPASKAYATFSVTTLSNLDWLGGKGYTHFGLYVHGVQYKRPNEEAVQGTHLPVLFVNLADPILSSREELGFPKLWCEIDVQRTDSVSSMRARWLGEKFCTMDITRLVQEESESSTPAAKDGGILCWKVVPQTAPHSTNAARETDVAHAVFVLNDKEMVEQKVDKVWKGKDDIKWDMLDWKRLPTLHHVMQRLQELRIYEIPEAKVVEGRGVSDVRAARRI